MMRSVYRESGRCVSVPFRGERSVKPTARAFQKRFYALVIGGLAIGCLAALADETVSSEQSVNPSRFEGRHIGNTQSIEKGRALYGNTCLFCHGAEGKGARAPTLVANAFAPDGGNDNAYFLAIIKNGRPGTIMGSFEGSLSETEMWQIIAYLRDVSKRLAQEQD